MTELDRYRPPDYDNPTGPYSRWAFRTEPLLEQCGDQWVAWHPGRDWSVSAPSEDEALRPLQEVSIGRPGWYAEDEAVCARHLQDPIPGSYAMDIGVYNRLRETESIEDINAAFEKAEHYR
ncbi:MAG: hypothetical protein ACRDTV_11670, partial [Mycobacterium sp.]